MLVGALTAEARAQVAPPAAALAGWDAYVRATEARIARERASPTGFFGRDFGPDATMVRRAARSGELVIAPWRTPTVSGTLSSELSRDVPQGQIHHWIGTVFVPGVTLSTLLERLHGVDVQRRQPDVLAARVLASEPGALSIFLRLRRTQIVTATYDTEHRVRFERLGTARALSTTVATRIVELADAGAPTEQRLGPGEDRGFLWRLNAWWRYEAVAGGVLIECESVSLSRRAPFGLGAVTAPFVTRVARESMTRTLDALRLAFTRPPQLSSMARGGTPL